MCSRRPDLEACAPSVLDFFLRAPAVHCRRRRQCGSAFNGCLALAGPSLEALLHLGMLTLLLDGPKHFACAVDVAQTLRIASLALGSTIHSVCGPIFPACRSIQNECNCIGASFISKIIVSMHRLSQVSLDFIRFCIIYSECNCLGGISYTSR